MNDPATTSHSSLDQRIFRSDSKLSPREINELLGIKVTLPQDTERRQRVRARTMTGQLFKLAIITIMLTSLALIGSMYQLKIGPFYEPEAIASSGS